MTYVDQPHDPAEFEAAYPAQLALARTKSLAVTRLEDVDGSGAKEVRQPHTHTRTVGRLCRLRGGQRRRRHGGPPWSALP